MKKNTIGCAVDSILLEDIDELCARRGFSRSDFVRTAIAIAMPWIKAGHNLDLTRVLISQEYQQAALALWVKDHHPEKHDILIETAFKRVEEYHG